MSFSQRKLRIPTQSQGIDIVSVRVNVPAGTDTSFAFTFARPFAAVPIPIGLVRNDATALDVAAAFSVASLTALGGTLRQKGITTVIQSVDVAFIGDYNNPTAY